jgi:hypothetical protein
MTYVLDNAHDAARHRMRLLAHLYDPATMPNFSGLPLVGADVWEIGAGSGSIAHTLAIAGARVTITDIDLRHLHPAAATEAHRVLEHDVTRDPPPGAFDLIHARLVLSHLPTWADVLPSLIGALRPGGWLCVEELDPMLDYVPAPQTPGDELVNRVGRAFTRALGSRGGDPTLGRRLPGVLAGCGLHRISVIGLILTGFGRSHIAELMAANVDQTEALLRAAGATPADLAAYPAALNDPEQRITMPVFWAARGQVNP